MAAEPLARCASVVERAVLTSHPNTGARLLGSLGGPPGDQPPMPVKNLYNRHQPAGGRGGARSHSFGASMMCQSSHSGLSASRLSLTCRNNNIFAKGRAFSSSGQSVDRAAETQGPLGLWGSQSWWDDFYARTAISGNVGAGTPAESAQLPSLDLRSGLPVKCRASSSNPNSPLSPLSPQSPDGFEWYVSAHHCAIVAAVRDELARITAARLGGKNCQPKLGFDPASAFSVPSASTAIDLLKSPTTISTSNQDGITLRILHVGCGTSSLGDAIAKLPLPAGVRGIQVTNIDMSPVAINYMKQRAKTLAAEETQLLGEEGANANTHNHASLSDYDVADIRRLPYADRSYDLIVDKGTLDAIVFGECDVRGAMREMTRVLLPDGAILSLSSDPPEVRWELLQDTAAAAQWGWWEVRRSELDPDEWLYHLYRGRMPSSPPSSASSSTA